LQQFAYLAKAEALWLGLIPSFTACHLIVFNAQQAISGKH
jgi:hypothetical protein